MAEPRLSTIQSIFDKMATMQPDEALRSMTTELWDKGDADSMDESMALSEALKVDTAQGIVNRLREKMRRGQVVKDIAKPGVTPPSPAQMGEMEKGVLAEGLVETAQDPLAQTIATIPIGGAAGQVVGRALARPLATRFARAIGPGAIRTGIRAIPALAPYAGQSIAAGGAQLAGGGTGEEAAKTGAMVGTFGVIDELLMRAADTIPGMKFLPPALKQKVIQNPAVAKALSRTAMSIGESLGINQLLGVDNFTLENMLMTGGGAVLSGAGALPRGTPEKIPPRALSMSILEGGPQAVADARAGAQSFLTGEQIRTAADVDFLAQQGLLSNALRGVPEAPQGLADLPISEVDDIIRQQAEVAAVGAPPDPQAPQAYQAAADIQRMAGEQVARIDRARSEQALALDAQQRANQLTAEQQVVAQTRGRVGSIRGKMAPTEPVLPIEPIERVRGEMAQLPPAPEMPEIPREGPPGPLELGKRAYGEVGQVKRETFGKGKAMYDQLVSDANQFDMEIRRVDPTAFQSIDAELRTDLKDIRTKFDAVANSAQGQFGVSPRMAMEIVGIIDGYLAKGESLGLTDYIGLKRDINYRAGNVLFSPNLEQADARAAAPAFQLRDAIQRAMDRVREVTPNLPEMGQFADDILKRKAEADSIYASGYQLESQFKGISRRSTFEVRGKEKVRVAETPFNLGQTLLSRNPDKMEKVRRLNDAIKNAASTAKLSPEIVPNLEQTIVQTRGNMEFDEIKKIMSGQAEATPELRDALQKRLAPDNPMAPVIEALSQKITSALSTADAQTALRLRQQPKLIEDVLFGRDDPTGARQRDYGEVVRPALMKMSSNERHSVLDAALSKLLNKTLKDGRVDPDALAQAKSQPYYADLPEPMRRGIDLLEAMGPSEVSAYPRLQPKQPSERVQQWEAVLREFSKLPKGMKSVVDILANNLVLGRGDVTEPILRMMKKATGEKGWKDIREGVIERLIRSDTDFLPDHETRVIYAADVLNRMEQLPQTVRKEIFGPAVEQTMATLRQEIPIQKGLLTVMGSPEEQSMVGIRRIISAQSAASAVSKNFVYSILGLAGPALGTMGMAMSGPAGAAIGLGAGLATAFAAGVVYPKYVAAKILKTPGVMETFLRTLKQLDDATSLTKAPGGVRGKQALEKQKEKETTSGFQPSPTF